MSGSCLNLFLLFFTVVSLQQEAICQKIKNSKLENIRIEGNCTDCKFLIESAGSKKREVLLSWDTDTKVATIEYDSLKTSCTNILKRIALSGFDNELFLAPTEAYENLPDCCKYLRKNKMHLEHDRKMEHNHER